MAIDTSFSIAFCVLYSQLVDHKDMNPDNLPSYNVIALDVLKCVDDVHADGQLKAHICKNLKDFVLRDRAIVDGLLRYIKHGKKIFIVSNSDYQYAKSLLEYAIDPYLDAGKTWQDLFEYTITFANKPRFFYEEHRFLRINPQDGTMRNATGFMKPGVYQGGYATKFTEDLNLKGDEILYIGDHIYGDILRLKKECNWRTALVVEELGEEIKAQIKARPVEKKIVAEMKIKRQIEEHYVDMQTHFFEHESRTEDEQLDKLQALIMKSDQKIARCIQQQHQYYNPKWGRVFRTGAEESYFAYQVDRYACIYMQQLVDLLEYSPLTYFRATRRLLAHDVDNLMMD